MAVKFNQRVKHGKVDFHPGVTYGFEDPDAEPYFKAAGWADDAGKASVDVTIGKDEIDIDPETVFASSNFGNQRGQRVVHGGKE